MSRICKNKNPSAYTALETFKKMRSKTMAATLVGIALVFLLGILTFTGVFSKDDPLYGFLLILSFCASLLSQFYPLIAQIVVARGVFGAGVSKDNVSSGSIIRHPEKLDELRSVDTLIVPKESLVRSHDVRLFGVYESSELYELEGAELPEGAKRLLKLALVSTGLYGSARLVSLGDTVKDHGYEREAIRRAVQDAGLYDSALDQNFPILDHRDADSECVFDTTLYSGVGQFVAVCRGESDVLLPRCTHYFENGRYVRITDNVRSRLESVARRLMRMSCTVLAVASNRSRYNRIKRIDELHSSMVFEGFICLEEPVLKNSSKMLKACADAGIKVILTFKDKCEQNYQFAKAQGFLGSRSEIGDLVKIYDNVGDILDYSVLENVSPEYMQGAVAYLQKKGRKVGYMGLELDDVPAMKCADVCFTQCETLSKKFVARGQSADKKIKGSGSWDALRFACDVVVSRVSLDEDGGFNAMVGAIMHAKTIFASLDRVLRYLFAGTIARLLMLVATLLSDTPLTTALQLILLGVFVDLPAVMIMAFEPSSKRILKEKPTKKEMLQTPGEYILPAVLGVVTFILSFWASVVSQNVSGVPSDHLCTVALLSLIACSWAMLVSSSSKELLIKGEIGFSKMFVAVLGAQVAELALFWLITPLGKVMGVYGLPWSCALIFLGVFVISLVINELLKLVCTDIFKAKSEKQHQKEFKDPFEDARSDEIENSDAFDNASNGEEININLESQSENLQ